MADEMLTGMLSKPKGPAAPGTTTNPYGGTVPSPVAQPPQTPGFQNNTANPQWWKGGAAPATTGAPAPLDATSGYGSSTPTPAPTPPPAGGGTGGGTVGGTGGGTTPAPPPSDSPKVAQAKAMMRNLEQRLLQERRLLIQLKAQGKTGNTTQARIDDIVEQMNYYRMVISRGY